MKNFSRRIILFSIYATFLYIVGLIVWGQFSPIDLNLNYKLGAGGHSFTRLKEVQEVKSIDLLFLGSSHTYLGFDTRFYDGVGINSFNLGTNSQTPLQTEYLLNKYLDSLNPRTVIIEVCPMVLSLDGVESTIEILSNQKIDMELIKLSLSQRNLKVLNTLIYALFREILFDEKNRFSENVVKGSDVYVKGGFLDKEMSYYKKSNFSSKTWKPNNVQLEALKRVINMIEKRSIQCLLIQSPVVTDYYHSYTNNEEFDSYISEYCKYFNSNEMLTLNDTIDFFDYHHVNKNGVKQFNQFVIGILDSHEMTNKMKKPRLK